MANFENKKIDFSQINGGVKFENGDVVSAEAINAPIEASAYAQEVAEEAKRIAEESGGGGSVDLSNYVQKTDYATATTAGVVKGNKIFGFNVNSDGIPLADILADSEYASKSPSYFISKGTLENHKYTFVYEGVTTNTIDLSDDEKTSACEWLGAVKKITDTTTYERVYTIATNGTQSTRFIGALNAGGRIPTYIGTGTTNPDAGGTIIVTTPKGNYDAANKKYVDDNFVGKTTSTQPSWKLYGASYGNDTKDKMYFGFPDNGNYNWVAFYNQDICLYTSDPKKETDAVNLRHFNNNTPTIYTDSDENNTTKKLRIYTDNFGYLHIDTE